LEKLYKERLLPRFFPSLFFTIFENNQIHIMKILVLVVVHGAGELVILHSPDSVQFSGHDPVDGKIVKEIFSASLGFTIKQVSCHLIAENICI